MDDTTKDSVLLELNAELLLKNFSNMIYSFEEENNTVIGCELLIDGKQYIWNGQALEEIKQVTLQEAADYLNVSVPYIHKLIGENHIYGQGGQVVFSTLEQYKRIMRIKADEALQELTRLDQELGLYDE